MLRIIQRDRNMTKAKAIKSFKTKGPHEGECGDRNVLELPPFYLHEEFKREFPELFPEGVIYHYTSSDVLCKLTSEDASLYATYYRSLNDDGEYDKGMSYVLKQYLPKCQKKIHLLLTKEFPELFDDGIDTGESLFLYTPWVTSFSLAPDLLSQWIAYTPPTSGGVAIGFDFDAMEQAIKTSVCVRRERCSVDAHALDYEMHFLPCIYLHDDHIMAKRMLDFLFEKYWPRFSLTVQSRVEKKQKRRAKAISALLVINLFSAIAKDASFFAEREFRIVLLVKDPDYLKKMELVGGKPRLKVPITEETTVKINKLISSVTISPHGDKRLLRSIVFFTRHRDGLKFNVYNSKSPYNGR